MVHPKVAKFLYQHLFLPPKLPQKDHDEYGAHELLKQVSIITHAFSKAVTTETERRVSKQIAHSTEQWIDIYDTGTPCRDRIVECLKNMQANGLYIRFPNDFLQMLITPRCPHVLCQGTERYNSGKTSWYRCYLRMFRSLTQDRCCFRSTRRLSPEFPGQSRVFVPRNHENTTFRARAWDSSAQTIDRATQ